MKIFLRDLRWILPISFGLGLALSLPGPGVWWAGWVAYAILLVVGLAAITAIWRSAGSARILGYMLILAVVIRLGLGIAFTYILPLYGDPRRWGKQWFANGNRFRR